MRDPRGNQDSLALGGASLERGSRYWRSLEELAERPEFREQLAREFPHAAESWYEPVARRDFLRLMAASLALAGTSGCMREPREAIVPYVRDSERIVPGRPLFFATAATVGSYATGVLVESHMGRPIKIEGNPDHPASLGATSAIAQASILDLYDPERSQTILERGKIGTWDRFLTAIAPRLEAIRARRGAGLRILTLAVTSPTLAAQLAALLGQLPEARWHQYEPLFGHNGAAGARAAFGQDVDTLYRFDRADVVLSLDADVVGTMPGSLRYARDLIDRRRSGMDRAQSIDRAQPSRLYVVETTLTQTGAVADHRLALAPAEIARFARALAARLGVSGVGGVAAADESGDKTADDARLADRERWLAAVAGELVSHRGASIVVVGEQQPPEVHVLAHAINARLGNSGSTVVYVEPVAARPDDQLASLRTLADDLAASRVGMLVILGGNPVYNAPAELEFATRMPSAFCVHLSEYEDETSELCHWHLPAAHYLESWGDVRALDGTATILQPLIAPLYDGRTPHAIISTLAGQPDRSAYELVQDYWRRRTGAGDFATRWQRWLHDGVIPGSESPPREVQLAAIGQGPAAQAEDNQSDELEVVFRADPHVWDGRYANNGWLQELPRPLTKLVWDNAALVSPATAERLAVSTGDVVTVTVGRRAVEAPVWIMPGHAERSITLTLGYGRKRSGRIGTGLGYSAYEVLPVGRERIARASVARTGRRVELVSTQSHWSLEGRDLVRTVGVDAYRNGSAGHAAPQEEGTAQHFDGTAPSGEGPEHKGNSAPHEELPSMYPAHDYTGHAWGMVIDQTACIGCNACVAACQAENNIPVVGREQVARGREMHWLRIDRYFTGEAADPATYFQPVPCMHCENAPCEPVCPVAATVHSSEGLNEMVYNRCVGTRYCSNNCPYKVRRFNFLEYSDSTSPTLKLLHNPDVTVRSRGVMEKCTYCVQRINSARIEAKKQDRPIRDGEIVTACQAACPTRAIVFGDINDPQSQVRKLKDLPINYGLLAELGTKPRTTYLARVENPNPALGHTARPQEEGHA